MGRLSAPVIVLETTVRRVPLTAGAVLLITAVAAGQDAVSGEIDARALLTIIGFYAATTGIIVAFAVWTAGEVGLPSFLLLQNLSRSQRWIRLLVHGVGMGVLLSLASVALAGSGEAGVLRPWFWRQIQSPAGAAMMAARSALLEESFFRLFLIPFLISVMLRVGRNRYRLRVRHGSAHISETRPEASRWLVLWAVLGSSFLFGLVHVFNPVPAMLLGPFLAYSYLRGGWESAVLAHFVANWLVFVFYF